MKDRNDDSLKTIVNIIPIIISFALFIVAHGIIIFQAYMKKDSIFIVGFILIDIAFFILGSYQDKHPKSKLCKFLKIGIPIETFIATIFLITGNFTFSVVLDSLFLIISILILYFSLTKKMEDEFNETSDDVEDNINVSNDNSHAIVLTVGSIVIVVLCFVFLAIVYFKLFGLSTYFSINYSFTIFIIYCVALFIACYVCKKYPKYILARKWRRLLIVFLMIVVELWLTSVYSFSIRPQDSILYKIFNGMQEILNIISEFPD